jgi:predicted nucleic acid-binding protein
MPRSAITMVADASVVVGWLADEPAAARVEAALRRSLMGGGIVVPAHFPVEVANALLAGERRGRWGSDQSREWLAILSRLRVRVEPPPDPVSLAAIAVKARDLGLSVYDAAYIELARRLRLPIMTFDRSLNHAADQEGVDTIE